MDGKKEHFCLMAVFGAEFGGNWNSRHRIIRHKGYPTAAHMDAVKEFGASPIHRRIEAL